MIISHKHRFIFIKTNKSAGTSIEIALSRFCGDKDIITPVSVKDEKIRTNLGYRGSQNCFVPITDYTFNDVAMLVRKNKRKLKYYNHISAREVRGFIGEETWNSYFKFCFERNPWDRLISLYYWRYKSEPRPSITEFIDSGYPLILKRRGYKLYTIDGKVAVDRVCLFENLNEELEEVRNIIKLPEKLDLPRTKSSYRKDRRSYHEILNEEEKQKISELFADEIHLFQYQF